MSLQLIVGNSGSGKSHYLYEQVIEAAVRSPKKNFLVVVPEQFTMQTQRTLVAMHSKHGLLNIDVLSFQRLAHRIFEEVGADKRRVLEETGKTLLLRRSAMKVQDDLKILKGNLKKQGYLLQMKSLISELTQYDIDAERMEQMQEYVKDHPALYYKLRDIDTLYEGFQKELEGKYITAEETLSALCQVAERSKILKDSIIALDGFTGFTPIQQKLLGQLLPLAAEVYVTVTIDAGENISGILAGGKGKNAAKEHELFYLSKKTIHMLAGLARSTQCEILPPVVMEWKTLPRFKESGELAFLEKHIFRSGRAVWGQRDTVAASAVHENDVDSDLQAPVDPRHSITLHSAASPVAEAHAAARCIRRHVMDGYRYGDIAVIVGDLPSYNSYIPAVFREYDIPCFMDSNRSVFSNPIIEFVRALLDMIQQDFTKESVFRYLRTGLCHIDTEKVDVLENYVLATGIRGYGRWKKPFDKQPKSITEEQLTTCEELRSQIMEPIKEVASGLKSSKTSVKEKTEKVYSLLCHYDMQIQMAEKEKEFQKAGKTELQKEYAVIYRMVIELLDKLVQLLGTETMTLEEYAQLLESGFEEAKVGMIPPSGDQVQVGDLERSRLDHIKILIFLGLNDGWVPGGKNSSGLLSDIEREMLENSGVELAPTARQNSYIQRFYLYLNLTKPSHYLHLSFSKAASDGSAMRPSYVIQSVQKLFPKLLVEKEEERGIQEGAFTPKNSLSYLVQGLQKIRENAPDQEWMELYRWYGEQESQKEMVKRLTQAAFLTFDKGSINRETARNLYGEVLAGSVSRLEKFAACAFSHFLQYGLLLQERETYEFQPVDMGNVFHKAMELYSESLQQKGYDWFTISQEEQERLSWECVEQVAEEYGGQILKDSARNEALVSRMKRIMSRTVWALHKQIRKGVFRPDGFEVSFSQARELKAVNIALTEEEKMRLRGRIDRIDVREEEDKVYVKVIDYKSGNTSFDMVALYYGLQLQLVVYLNAAMELEKRRHPDKEIVPAGIFYYHMQDPLLLVDGDPTAEEIDQKILRQLRPDGLVNADKEVVRRLDQNFTKTSDVIPVTKNKDGLFSKQSKTVTSEEFEQISDYVHQKLQDLGQNIMEGEIAPVPYQRKQQTACDHCIYRSVCALDGRIPGTHTKRLKEMKKDEIKSNMAKDEP